MGYCRNNITSVPGTACQGHDTFAYGPLEHLVFPLALYLIAICGRPKLLREAMHTEFTNQLTACVDFRLSEHAIIDVWLAPLSDGRGPAGNSVRSTPVRVDVWFEPLSFRVAH